MAAPLLISTDNLAPVRPTRAMLHDIACRTGESAFKDGIEVVPTWFIASGTRIVAIATPWESTMEKRVLQRMVRVLLHAIGAQAYAFLSETWTAQVNDPDPVRRQAKIDWIDEHGVMALPRSEREELLMVCSSGRREEDQAMSRYIINSGGKKPWLGLRVDEQDAREHSGPMFGLFREPLPEPELLDMARRALAEMEADRQRASN